MILHVWKSTNIIKIHESRKLRNQSWQIWQANWVAVINLPKIITFRLQVQGKMIFSTCYKNSFQINEQVSDKLLGKLAKQWLINSIAFGNQPAVKTVMSGINQKTIGLGQTWNFSWDERNSNLGRPDRLLGHRAPTQSVHVADVFYGKCTGFTICFICRSLSSDMCMDQC